MFKLKYPSKPIERRRIRQERRIYLDSYKKVCLSIIKEAINKVEKEGVCLNTATMTIGHYAAVLSYYAPESDIDLLARQQQHIIEMEHFENWKVEHAEEISEAMQKKKTSYLEKAEKNKKEMEFLEQLYNS